MSLILAAALHVFTAAIEDCPYLHPRLTAEQSLEVAYRAFRGSVRRACEFEFLDRRYRVALIRVDGVYVGSSLSHRVLFQKVDLIPACSPTYSAGDEYLWMEMGPGGEDGPDFRTGTKPATHPNAQLEKLGPGREPTPLGTRIIPLVVAGLVLAVMLRKMRKPKASA